MFTTFGWVISPFLNLILFVDFYIVKWPFWAPPWRNWLDNFFGDFSVLTHDLATMGVAVGDSDNF